MSDAIAAPSPGFKVIKVTDEGMRVAGTTAWGEVWEVLDVSSDPDGLFVGFFNSEEAANAIATLLNQKPVVQSSDVDILPDETEDMGDGTIQSWYSLESTRKIYAKGLKDGAALRQQAPDGWVLVPREPRGEVIGAMQQAHSIYTHGSKMERAYAAVIEHYGTNQPKGLK